MKRASKSKNSLPLRNTGHTPSTKRCILEISDEEVVREMIAAICKSRGFDVIQARCGDEAPKLYRKCRPVMLVLSDLYWYDGGGIEPPLSDTKTIKHGIQLALAIRKLDRAQNIVIHTGAFNLREQMPKELGHIRILEKPFRKEESESLLSVVNE